MATAKLYQSDIYLREWRCNITSVTPLKDDGDNDHKRYIITLDKTAFFPEGGGQSCDIGFIEEIQSGDNTAGSGFSGQITDVQERGGEILHTVVSTSLPAESMELRCMLDWNRRFDNMQRHCGEHILSGALYRLYGAVNRGFHMGDSYMTIDMRLEKDSRYSELTNEMLKQAELLANQTIWNDLPISVSRFDSRGEAEKMPLRKALAFDEDISIVTIGSVEDPADCVACCGTHPATAGQVGLIKVYKVEKYKDMFRVYFDAGRRALEDYEVKHDILTALSDRYSSSVENFPKALEAQEKKSDVLRDELFHLKKALIDGECRRLDEILQQNKDRVIVYPLHRLSLDDAFNMAKRYMGKADGSDVFRTDRLILLYTEKETSYVLVSDGGIHCGKLVREYASFYSGKGGGSDVSARAIFPSSEDAELFAELLRKHLQ